VVLFQAIIAGYALDLRTQTTILAFADDAAGEGGSVELSGNLVEEDVPPGEEWYDHGPYTLMIHGEALAEECVTRWWLGPGELRMLFSPTGAAELDLPGGLAISFPRKHTTEVELGMAKIVGAELRSETKF